MKILGISAYYHDSAAAIIENGHILAAVQEERFSRKKHDSSFPSRAIEYCLDHSGFSLDELDAVVFYDKPFLKFERLLETYYNFAPIGIRTFSKAIPVWIKEKLFLKRAIKKGLSNIQKYDKRKLTLLFPEHHLSHAASAFFPSPFETAAILTVDGVGEWATASISKGEGNRITQIKELHFPHSLGLLYSAFTYFLGFRVNSGEYKLMGLAPYGNAYSKETERFIKIIEENLVDIKEDGSIWLDQKYFNDGVGLRMVKDGKWEELFGFPKREPEEALDQKHCNLGLAIQKVTEKVILKMAAEAKRLTGCNYLCLAGGVALNCVANGKLQNANIFDNIFIQPAAGDAGGALGGALAANYLFFEKKRILTDDGMDGMQGSYLGPEFSDLDIQRAARKYKAKFEIIDDNNRLYNIVADCLSNDKVVGWFQGRMEYGPRALGNRSILGNPTNPEMQKRINLKIKYRESFRPFAPSVLSEDCSQYFEYEGKSPYMLLVHNVQTSLRKNLPEGYFDYPLKEKLYYQRSELPAITHIDFSARIQTVHKETNPKYHDLLQAVKRKTGIGMVVNTSFNVRGEPIVCSPEDAYACFINTEMDVLVMSNYVFYKSDQNKSVLKNEERVFQPD